MVDRALVYRIWSIGSWLLISGLKLGWNVIATQRRLAKTPRMGYNELHTTLFRSLFVIDPKV
jgi:hypothetical protein